MNHEELKAAVERLRRHRAGESAVTVWPAISAAARRDDIDADLWRVAGAYLEHLADEAKKADRHAIAPSPDGAKRWARGVM